MNRKHDGQFPAITLSRTYHGPDWTITVPADGKDHRKELARAKKEALALWRQLYREFEEPAAPGSLQARTPR